MSSATDQETKNKADKNQEARNERIGRRVLLGIEQPAQLRQVQVRLLWDDHFRVNVFTNDDAGSTKIAHSFFVQADSEGNILQSNPSLLNKN